MKATVFPPPSWGIHALHGWRRTWLRLLHQLPAGSAWRRIALWLRSPLKRALPEVVDAEIWGLKLRLWTRDNLSEQRLLLLPRHLDAVERKCLAAELKSGDCFLDIGANAGVYSLWVAATCGRTIRVEAFEPDPELCARLSFNLASNGLDQVHLHAQAIGRTEGRVHLLTGHKNRGENRITTEATPATTIVSVPITTLPRFLAGAGITAIAALKIDVEGMETEVLTPLFEAAPRTVWPRLIVCELVHDRYHHLSQLLAQHGYQLASSGRLNGIYRLGP